MPEGEAMPNDVTIQKYTDSINKSWRKTTQSVLETAKLCAEAQNNLNDDERKKLIEDLDFDKATSASSRRSGHTLYCRPTP